MSAIHAENLCKAIASVADARANLAVVRYRQDKNELPIDGEEIRTAIELVGEAEKNLEETIRNILRDLGAR